MTSATWYTSTFAEDAARTKLDPSPEDGDGRVYVVRNIFGDYLAPDIMRGGFSSWTDRKDHAKRFYDGQAAWGAATKSIYPAEVLVVRGKRVRP